MNNAYFAMHLNKLARGPQETIRLFQEGSLLYKILLI